MTALSWKFEKALIYAARTHKDQKRKTSGVSYVGHLLSVASIVIEYRGTEDEVIAALLHDAIEDQGADKEQEIRNMFGNEVASIVVACSDSFETPKPPWKERKVHHIEKVQTAPIPVLLVTAADKLSNMRMLLDDYRYARLKPEVLAKFWEPFRGGRDGSMWYYKEMCSAIGRGCMENVSSAYYVLRVLEELTRTVEELEGLIKKYEHDEPKGVQGSAGVDPVQQ